MNDRGWNQLIAGLPGAHPLQTREWGALKAQFGWRPHHLLWLSGQEGIRMEEFTPDFGGTGDPDWRPVAAALALVRPLPLGGFGQGLSIVYTPRGPLLDWGDLELRGRVTADLAAFARRHKAVLLKIDPEVRLGTGVPGRAGAEADPLGREVESDLESAGWRFSPGQVQFRNTVLLDLSPSEEELLAAMKQKTRYNIRLAGRRGVSVRVGDEADLETLYQMYAETCLRDGFVIRDPAYYRAAWGSFLAGPERRADEPLAEPLIAEVEGEPVAAVIIFQFAGRAWYLYGMSRAVHRNKMPTYVLQWEAIRRARAAGCRIYDLWGAPNEFIESDPLWGVYRFKEGFSGTVVRYLGAWDLPLRPLYDNLYTRWWPRVLQLMRLRGRASTQATLEAA